MARWSELLVLALLVFGQQSEAPLPVAVGDAPRAVLLEAGDFFEQPSSDDQVTRFEAGTVFEFVGEASDAFGRVWYGVRDPRRLERRTDVYLAPFKTQQFRDFGYRGALLANRLPALPTAAARPAQANLPRVIEPPWWLPAGVLEAGHEVRFEDIVGISAWAPEEAVVREALDVLGGVEAIAVWPTDPLPGELFVPELLPALFQFDGADWNLARPVRFLSPRVSILGNAGLAVDSLAPPLAGGLALHCWDLVGALNPSGAASGSLTAAPPPRPPQRGQPLPPDFGPFDLSQASPNLRALMLATPPTMRVPQRVDPVVDNPGVLLIDNDGRQAVYLQQSLGEQVTRRLRGETMALDVMARNNATGDAATFGIDIEIDFADGRPAENLYTAFTGADRLLRYEWIFEVPDDAVDIIVRLLPLDRSLALEGQGAVVFDSVGLRPAHWDPTPPTSVIPLFRVTVSSFEGATLYTRAPVGITTRAPAAAREAWERVQAADWTTEDDQLILAGELRPGMTRNQVRAAWGEPDEEAEVASGSTVNWTWKADGRRVTFDGDSVMTYRRAAAVGENTPPIRCLPGTGR